MQTTVINAVAPTRICDVGGWTDTRFARSGAVFNIAIYPYVEVQIHSSPSQESEIAAVAHSIETKELGLECGVQDQLASVHGGINLIEIDEFPHARVSNVTHLPFAARPSSVEDSNLLKGREPGSPNGQQCAQSPVDEPELGVAVPLLELIVDRGVQRRGAGYAA